MLDSINASLPRAILGRCVKEELSYPDVE